MTAQPLEIRMAHLEGAYEQLDRRLGDLARTIDSHFAQVDSRFSQVDTNFQTLNQKVDTLQWRLTSLVVVTWITTILAVLLHRS